MNEGLVVNVSVIKFLIMNLYGINRTSCFSSQIRIFDSDTLILKGNTCSLNPRFSLKKTELILIQSHWVTVKPKQHW